MREASRLAGEIREIGSGPFSPESECKEGGREEEERKKNGPTRSTERGAFSALDERTPAAIGAKEGREGRGRIAPKKQNDKRERERGG